jgi:hypothetical protein
MGFFPVAFPPDAGEIFSFGVGYGGRLGHGTTDDQLLPKMVETLSGDLLVDVACGREFSVTVTSALLLFYFVIDNTHNVITDLVLYAR